MSSVVFVFINFNYMFLKFLFLSVLRLQKVAKKINVRSFDWIL